MRLHERYRFGQLADLLLLDTRQFRDLQVCGTPQRPSGSIDPATCNALNDPARTLLGAVQERWLDETLARSTPGWTVLGPQGLFGRRDNLPGAGERIWNDGWDGYAPARQRLTDSLQRHRLRLSSAVC